MCVCVWGGGGGEGVTGGTGGRDFRKPRMSWTLSKSAGGVLGYVGLLMS